MGPVIPSPDFIHPAASHDTLLHPGRSRQLLGPWLRPWAEYAPTSAAATSEWTKSV